MWRSNDSVYSTFSPFYPPLKAQRGKLFGDDTTQLDRLITPPPYHQFLTHTDRQAGAGMRCLPVYKLSKNKDYDGLFKSFSRFSITGKHLKFYKQEEG